MANSWFRLWTDMVNDPKWRTIARVSKQKIGDVIAVYVHMMTMAANATERGRTEGFNDEDVATALDIDTEQVTAIREAMQGRVLDGDYLTGWEKRQPLREDGAAERGKAFRERKKAEKERTQTQPNAAERQIRREEIREEEKNNDNTSAQAGSAVVLVVPGETDNPRSAELPPREEPPGSADPAIGMAVALRKLGVDATFTHPAVQDWSTRKIAMDVLNAAVALAREQKGPTAKIAPNYLVPIVDKLLHPPAAAAPAFSKPAPPIQIRKPEGMDPKGTDESYEEYDARIAAAENARRRGASR